MKLYNYNKVMEKSKRIPAQIVHAVFWSIVPLSIVLIASVNILLLPL